MNFMEELASAKSWALELARDAEQRPEPLEVDKQVELMKAQEVLELKIEWASLRARRLGLEAEETRLQAQRLELEARSARLATELRLQMLRHGPPRALRLRQGAAIAGGEAEVERAAQRLRSSEDAPAQELHASGLLLIEADHDRLILVSEDALERGGHVGGGRAQ